MSPQRENNFAKFTQGQTQNPDSQLPRPGPPDGEKRRCMDDDHGGPGGVGTGSHDMVHPETQVDLRSPRPHLGL